MAIAGWYTDPTGHGDGRYWDGQRWSDQVNRSGVTVTSPIDPALADTPPAPGTEYIVSVAADTPVAPAPAPKSSPLGPVLGAIAVVVAIIAIVIALTSGSDDDEDDEQPPTTTVETTEAPETTEVPSE